MSQSVEPVLGIESFTCPHCGAFAHQQWFRVLAKTFSSQARPAVTVPADFDQQEIEKRINNEGNDAKAMKLLKEFIERLYKNDLTYFAHEYSESAYWEMHNIALSHCFSCKGFAVWINDGIVYPQTQSTIIIHEDLPPSMRSEVEEAREILDRSPRGAAALLRLAIQNMMPDLNVHEDNLDKAIGVLVKRGLDEQIQQAFDVLRIVGNNSVHPGQIDMSDNREMALKLFMLINLIVETLITRPKQVKELFKGMPEGALKAIARRDAPKAIEDKTT